jgi:hypothetical protein
MTDQERQLLEQLADRIQKAPAPQIDRDADELIRRKIGSRPDALYILTQTVLIQEIALNQAMQQIEQLKRQQPQSSFLGNAPPQGSAQSGPQGAPQGGTAWGQNRPAPPPSGYRASSYQSGSNPQPAPTASPAPPPLPDYGGQQQPSRFSGFLQNAAQTAAGVVAGEVAFSALSSLFGGHHGGYGGGGGFLGGGGSFVSPGSETIINNYYEGDRGNENSGRQFASENDTSDYSRDDSASSLANDVPDDPSYDSTDDSTDDTQDVSDDIDDSSSYDDGSDSVDV